jgi:hypothetical protein
MFFFYKIREHCSVGWKCVSTGVGEEVAGMGYEDEYSANNVYTL